MPKSKAGAKRLISTWVLSDDYDQLKELAGYRKVSAAYALNTAIHEYLERNNAELKAWRELAEIRQSKPPNADQTETLGFLQMVKRMPTEEIQEIVAVLQSFLDASSKEG